MFTKSIYFVKRRGYELDSKDKQQRIIRTCGLYILNFVERAVDTGLYIFHLKEDPSMGMGEDAWKAESRFRAHMENLAMLATYNRTHQHPFN